MSKLNVRDKALLYSAEKYGLIDIGRGRDYRTLNRLVNRGLLILNQGIYRITEKGRAAVSRGVAK